MGEMADRGETKLGEISIKILNSYLIMNLVLKVDVNNSLLYSKDCGIISLLFLVSVQ
jgi:hypothetical protein